MRRQPVIERSHSWQKYVSPHLLITVVLTKLRCISSYSRNRCGRDRSTRTDNPWRPRTITRTWIVQRHVGHVSELLIAKVSVHIHSIHRAYGVAVAYGPLIGGALAHCSQWRWLFCEYDLYFQECLDVL
jgi:hypothetical protein